MAISPIGLISPIGAHLSHSCVKEGFNLPRPVARRGLRLGREQE
jgi:hypothetical protein